MTEAERDRERRRIRRDLERSVVIHNSKYGWTDPETKKYYPFTVSVNNKVLTVVYEHWKRISGIHGAPSEKQRIEWEIPLKKLLCRLFRELYHYKLNKLFTEKGEQTPHMQYQERQLEELVAMLDPNQLIKELYGKGN